MLSGLQVRLGYKAFAETKHSSKQEEKGMGVDAVEGCEFAAFVGIDWAEQKHVLALQDVQSGRIQVDEIEHTPEAVDAWAMELSQRYQERPIAIALEQVRGSLVFMLTKYKHLVIFPIHPATLANYRKSFRPSGAKGDPHDAGLLLDLLTRHREKLRCITPDTAETRTLRFLVEERRKLVNERIRFSQRLTSHLKLYFPQVLNWFCDISSQIAEEFLERWPTLESVQKARTKTLERFFADHNSRSPEKIKARLEEIRRAVTATNDSAVITASSSAALALVKVLHEIRDAISSYDSQIEKLAHAHPDFLIFDSFPGAGAALAPRQIAALGTCRDRYRTAHEIQCYSGIAPVVESSGRQHWVHYRWSCPKFLRQTFHEWALHSMASSAWAKDHYKQLRAKGKSHHSAVRALAFKWIRILFRCWQDHQPYNATLYENARQSRSGEPKTCSSPVNIEWKTRSGFSKLSRASS
jgi:transposase